MKRAAATRGYLIAGVLIGCAVAALTVAQARAYADEGQFGKGSMEPKVRAAIRFCEGRPDRTAVIGSLERAPEAVRGTSGTRIHY